jgi:hypothetical protein
MDAIYTYDISSPPKTSPRDGVSLRPHEWVDWKRLVVSPIAAVIVATATTIGSNDLSCDLLDSLSGIGLNLPLSLLVECDSQNYLHWHKLAGDQDWIRGTYCVEPLGVDDESSQVMSAMLTDAAAAYVHPYSLVTISDQRYAEIVSARLSDEKNEAVRVLARFLLNALSEEGLMRAGDAVGKNRMERAVARWMNEEVIARALGSADTSEQSTSLRNGDENS